MCYIHLYVNPQLSNISCATLFLKHLVVRQLTLYKDFPALFELVQFQPVSYEYRISQSFILIYVTPADNGFILTGLQSLYERRRGVGISINIIWTVFKKNLILYVRLIQITTSNDTFRDLLIAMLTVHIDSAG